MKACLMRMAAMVVVLFGHIPPLVLDTGIKNRGVCRSALGRAFAWVRDEYRIRWYARQGYMAFRSPWGLRAIPAGGADMTGTTMATWIPETWSIKPTVTYRSNTVLAPLMNHQWESELRGDTVNIPGFTQNNAARNRGAGTGTFGTGATLTFDASTEAQLQLVVNRFYYKAFRQPLELVPQQMGGYLTMLIAGQGSALALQVDADLGSDNTNGIDAFSTVVGTDNVDITEDDLLTITTNLNNQNAPITQRYGVVSPASWASIMGIESVRNSLYAQTVGNLAGDRGAGFVGKVLAFEMYMSNNLESGTSGKKNGFFHTEAIAFAEQVSVRTEVSKNLEDGGFQQYLTYQTCGFLEIKDSFGNEVAGK